MKSTGFSPFTTLLREIRLQQTTHHEENAVLRGLIEQLYTLVEKLPNNCATEIENRVQVNAQVLTLSGIQESFNKWFGPSINQIKDDINSLKSNGILNHNVSSNNNNSNSNANVNLSTLLSYGNQNHFPDKFIFPSYTLDIMWNCWYLGEAVNKIPPLRLIEESRHVLICIKDSVDYTRRNQTNYSRCKSIINMLVTTAKANEISMDGIETAAPNIVSELYTKANPLLLAKLYNKVPKNSKDININTLYNRWVSKNQPPKATNTTNDNNAQNAENPGEIIN